MGCRIYATAMPRAPNCYGSYEFQQTPLVHCVKNTSDFITKLIHQRVRRRPGALLTWAIWNHVMVPSAAIDNFYGRNTSSESATL
jgi:hypothetical protein